MAYYSESQLLPVGHVASSELPFIGLKSREISIPLYGRLQRFQRLRGMGRG